MGISLQISFKQLITIVKEFSNVYADVHNFLKEKDLFFTNIFSKMGNLKSQTINTREQGNSIGLQHHV